MKIKINNNLVQFILFIIFTTIFIKSSSQESISYFEYKIKNINQNHGFYFIEFSTTNSDSIDFQIVDLSGNPSSFKLLEIKYNYLDSSKVISIAPSSDSYNKYSFLNTNGDMFFRILGHDKWNMIPKKTKKIVFVLEKDESFYIIRSKRELSIFELLEIRKELQENLKPRLVKLNVCDIRIEI